MPLSNGVMQPFRQLGWWRWMYRLSPYTYLIEGLLGQALGRQDINCSPVEFVQLSPPSGQTCQSYMENFMSFAGGYLSNPEATEACNYCSSRTTDQFLINSFNIFYEHHWRNLGFMLAFTAFNVSLALEYGDAIIDNLCLGCSHLWSDISFQNSHRTFVQL